MPMIMMMAMTVRLLITGFILVTNDWNVTSLVWSLVLRVAALGLGGRGGSSMVTETQVRRKPSTLDTRD